jgi:putative hydrolase of the HAD superfamily
MITRFEIDPAKLGPPMPSSARTATRAVLFDALGTLVDLEPPWVHLATVLEMDEADVAPAVKAEMDFYKEHAHEGKDDKSLEALRNRCAEILSWELDREVPVVTMMEAIRFRAFDDARPALDELHEAGLRIICVSNWDISLPDVLKRCGLDKAVDGVVTSAGTGVKKPDPAIFQAGLALAGCSADEAIHVGDTVDEDVAGAGAAGIRALHLDRAGGGDITSLAEVSRAVSGG